MSSTQLARGRVNQKTRTRMALLDTARQLIEHGEDPTLEHVAEAALVSRATAYRYFSSVDELLAEASIDGPELGTPDEVLSTLDPGADLADRVDHVVRHVTRRLLANPRATHLMMRSVYDLWLIEPESRVGRRIDFLEAALSEHGDLLNPLQRSRLLHSLALVCGAEAVISALDVCRLDTEEAIATIAWAARSLVHQSLID